MSGYLLATGPNMVVYTHIIGHTPWNSYVTGGYAKISYQPAPPPAPVNNTTSTVGVVDLKYYDAISNMKFKVSRTSKQWEHLSAEQFVEMVQDLVLTATKTTRVPGMTTADFQNLASRLPNK